MLLSHILRRTSCCLQHVALVQQRTMACVAVELPSWNRLAASLISDSASRSTIGSSCRIFSNIHGDVVSVAAGCGFSAIIGRDKRNNQQLYMLGSNEFGQLGLGSLEPTTQPQRVMAFADHHVLQVSCGRAHTIVLTDQGVYGSGSVSLLQYGLSADDVMQSYNSSQRCSTRFTPLHALTGLKITKIASGFDHSLFLSEEGDIFSCGWGTDGQVGVPSPRGITAVTRIPMSSKVSDIFTGADCCFAVTCDGDVFSWGNSEYGQTGHGTETQQITQPTKLTHSLPSTSSLTLNPTETDDNHVSQKHDQNVSNVDQTRTSRKVAATDIQQISVGGSFSLIRSNIGHVYSVGYGVIGISKEQTMSFEPVEYLASQSIAKVSAGNVHAAVITKDGKLYMWGPHNLSAATSPSLSPAACASNLTAINRTSTFSLPQQVPLPWKLVDIACGVDHSIAVVDLD